MESRECLPHSEPSASTLQPVNTSTTAVINLLCVQYHPLRKLCLLGAFEKKNHPGDITNISCIFFHDFSFPQSFYIETHQVRGTMPEKSLSIQINARLSMALHLLYVIFNK